MIITTLKIETEPDKRKELLQTINSLSKDVRKEKGCLAHGFYQDTENENNFILVEGWKSRKDLDNHLKTDSFGVLLGAIGLLCRSPEIIFSTVSDTAGMEAVKAARK